MKIQTNGSLKDYLEKVEANIKKKDKEYFNDLRAMGVMVFEPEDEDG